MNLDEIDIKILKENFDEELITQIDIDSVSKIFKYLENNGIYYAKDLFLTSLDLFLYPLDDFIRKFEVFLFLFTTLFPTCYNYFGWE